MTIISTKTENQNAIRTEKPYIPTFSSSAMSKAKAIGAELLMTEQHSKEQPADVRDEIKLLKNKNVSPGDSEFMRAAYKVI